MTAPPTAMVLAAGRGERMQPLSLVLPKPALPLPDGPLAASALRAAATVTSASIAVNTCYLADRMERVLGEVELAGHRLRISRELSLMGTGGGLAVARDRGLLGDDGPVLVINGDSVVNLELEPLLQRHDTARDLVTLALLPHPNPRRWSRVRIDDGGAVAGIRPPGDPEPDEVPLLYPGVMLISRRALDSLPSSPGGVDRVLWWPALEAGRLGGVVVAGRWREIGTPSDYRSEVLRRVEACPWVDPRARVEDSATIDRSLIGAGCQVAAGARVVRSILAEGVRVEAGATVADCLLMGAVQVSRGASLVGELRVGSSNGRREDS
jgi:NDP-sugar pyrophosphorylase family protein